MLSGLSMAAFRSPRFASSTDRTTSSAVSGNVSLTVLRSSSANSGFHALQTLPFPDALHQLFNLPSSPERRPFAVFDVPTRSVFRLLSFLALQTEKQPCLKCDLQMKSVRRSVKITITLFCASCAKNSHLFDIKTRSKDTRVSPFESTYY